MQRKKIGWKSGVAGHKVQMLETTERKEERTKVSRRGPRIAMEARKRSRLLGESRSPESGKYWRQSDGGSKKRMERGPSQIGEKSCPN